MNIKSKLFIKNFQKDSGKGTLCLHQKIPFSWNSAPRKTGRIDSFYFLLFWFYYNMNHFLFQTILLSFHLLPYIWRLNIDNICLASYSFLQCTQSFMPWRLFPYSFRCECLKGTGTWAPHRQTLCLFLYHQFLVKCLAQRLCSITFKIIQ